MADSSKLEELLRTLLKGCGDWAVERRKSLMMDHDWRLKLVIDQVGDEWSKLIDGEGTSKSVQQMEDRIARLERDMAALRLKPGSIVGVVMDIPQAHEPVTVQVGSPCAPPTTSEELERIGVMTPQEKQRGWEWRDRGQGDWAYAPKMKEQGE